MSNTYTELVQEMEDRILMSILDGYHIFKPSDERWEQMHFHIDQRCINCQYERRVCASGQCPELPNDTPECSYHVVEQVINT